MDRQRIKPKQGTILISEPSLRDFFFRQSVILLAEHNEEGTFGLIINKPIEVKLKEIIKGFPAYKLPVYLGGPVKTDSLYYLHTHGEIEGSLLVMDGLYWGGDLDKIRELMKLKEMKFIQ